MSAFRAGQRVRILDRYYVWPDRRGIEVVFIRYETPLPSENFIVPCDCTVRLPDGRESWMASEGLAPLTDPKESEWADAMVKKVTKPEPQKVMPWVTA